MLGFKPLPPEVVKAVDPQVQILDSLWMLVLFILISHLGSLNLSKLQLETINKNLEAYYDAWHKYVKSWIVIKIQDPSYVYQWRLQVCYVISSAFSSTFILVLFV